MKLVELDIPPGCKVYNCLYSTRDPEYLLQDQLVIKLPNDVFIDVGWTPEHDINGHYVVRVYREDWDNILLPICTTSNINKLVWMVEYIAWWCYYEPK